MLTCGILLQSSIITSLKELVDRLEIFRRTGNTFYLSIASYILKPSTGWAIFEWVASCKLFGGFEPICAVGPARAKAMGS